MQFAYRLQMAAAITVLFSAQAALAQTTPLLPLKATSAHPGFNDYSYKTLGKIGMKESETFHLSAVPRPADPSSVPGVPSPGFYPGDLSNGGGATIEKVRSHPIYVDAAPATWGDVPGFLTDYGKSKMIHIVDQYVGSDDNDRYKLGSQFAATGYPIPSTHTFSINDIFNLVYAGASLAGSGYDHIYHVFLPPGADMCLGTGASAQCYSPDKPATWYFCAFHGSVDFTGPVGHVLFSVEPYQDVPGCSVPPTGLSVNQLNDSTDTVLSHELTEAITDPDGDAWWVHAGTSLGGAEIGDICTRSGLFPDGNYYWDYGVVRLNGHPYTIQPEYSNAMHGCAYVPPNNED